MGVQQKLVSTTNIIGRVPNEASFEFESATNGNVIIEVEYLYSPKAVGDSDWDQKSHLEILSYTVFKNSQVIYIDIPEKDLYSSLSTCLRDTEAQEAFDEESGGF